MLRQSAGKRVGYFFLSLSCLGFLTSRLRTLLPLPMRGLLWVCGLNSIRRGDDSGWEGGSHGGGSTPTITSGADGGGVVGAGDGEINRRGAEAQRCEENWPRMGHGFTRMAEPQINADSRRFNSSPLSAAEDELRTLVISFSFL